MVARPGRNEQSWVPNVYRQHRYPHASCYPVRQHDSTPVPDNPERTDPRPRPTRPAPGYPIRARPTTLSIRAPIAQLVELRTFNPQVVGSSPTGGTFSGVRFPYRTPESYSRPHAVATRIDWGHETPHSAAGFPYRGPHPGIPRQQVEPMISLDDRLSQVPLDRSPTSRQATDTKAALPTLLG